MTQSNGRRRVVVTGKGVVTPLGTGVGRFWTALKNGDFATYGAEMDKVEAALRALGPLTEGASQQP